MFPWRHERDAQHPALKAAQDGRTVGERVADEIASFGGSWPFIFIFLGLIIAWMILANTDLTQQVHDLTQKVHTLTEHLCSTSG